MVLSLYPKRAMLDMRDNAGERAAACRGGLLVALRRLFFFLPRWYAYHVSVSGSVGNLCKNAQVSLILANHSDRVPTQDTKVCFK